MGDNIFLFLLICLTVSLLTPAVSESQTQGKAKNTTVIMPLGSSAATSGVGYEPAEVTVSPGDSVIWDNQDNALHTATSGNPDTATPDGKFDTGLVGANQESKPVTMPTEPGEYAYFCTLHPFLGGTVTVTSSTLQTEEPPNIIANTSGANMSSNTGLLAMLLDDVGRDLQNRDISTALLHLDLVKKELEVVGNPTVEILVNDAIQDLNASETDRALLHLNLAKRHLSMLSGSDVSKGNETSTFPAQANAQDNFLRYENISYGISIQYPSNWTFGHYDFNPYDAFVYVVTFETPFESSSDQYAERVDVSIDMIGQPGNLQEYLDYVIDSYSVKSDFHIYGSDTSSTLAGHPAYRLDYRNLDNLTYVKHRTLEVGTIIGDLVYYITYEAQLSKYDDYLPAVQKMIESFKVTNVGLRAQENRTYFGSTENFTSSSGYDNITSYYNQTSGNTTFYPYNYSNATFGTGQPSVSRQNQINWGAICRNAIVDSVITEPCHTLTTPDGYALTQEGERVLRCLAGGALVGLLAPELLIQIKELGPAVNCGGTNDTSGTASSGVADNRNVNGSGNSTIVAMTPGSTAATSGQGYEPGQVTVAPGATIIWHNLDSTLHTATSGNPAIATPDGKFDTGLVGTNQQSKPVTMPTQPGEYSYFCTLHPFLVGSVTVQ